jgi:hypothetical protein
MESNLSCGAASGMHLESTCTYPPVVAEGQQLLINRYGMDYGGDVYVKSACGRGVYQDSVGAIPIAA